LFDDDATDGIDLPEALRGVYGRWPLPEKGERPYTYVNFVASRDGRISFSEPGYGGGGPISGNNLHDRWLMGLLRARADAVIISAGEVAENGRHSWRPEAIFPNDGEAWGELRRGEGREPVPLHVVVTRSGMLRADAMIFNDPAVPVLVASGDEGVDRARQQVGKTPNIRFWSSGDELDYAGLVEELGRSFGVKTLLSEAGPRVYGAMLQAGVVDDEFLTMSPILTGNSEERPRLGLVEGVGFEPVAPPRSRLLALYRAGDFLFLHSRYTERRTGNGERAVGDFLFLDGR
jgi:riboflavin biosynthesis pyrimidine reductase